MSIRSADGRLAATLFDGPIDVVGDVHGERDALDDLLRVLGYRAGGDHPAGRRLVFIGDLCDRGPDSPGVLRLVRTLVAEGTAQCLLGNHEMNVLRGVPKEANGWFFAQDHDRARGLFQGSRPAADEAERQSIREFCGELPLLLERRDLRLVHACWNDARIAEVRGAGRDTSSLDLYRRYAAQTEEQTRLSGLAAEAEAELAAYGHRLRERAANVPMLPALAERDLAYQLANPVRVLTSGVERRTASPFYLSGKWRMVERADWWEDYDSDVPVLFGHYWRWPRPDAGAMYGEHARNPFPGCASNSWLGPRHTAFCIDYCAGARYYERLRRPGEPVVSRLAALRWPERELLFDDGSGTELSPPAPPRD